MCNLTDMASYVNRFVDSVVHDIGQTHPRCEKSGDTHNMGLAIAGGQWLNKVLCYYFTFVLADSLVLLNARRTPSPEPLPSKRLAQNKITNK